MFLVRPKHKIIDNINQTNILHKLEKCGRVSHKSESKGNPSEFIKKIIKLGHESVLEHHSITVKFTMDRGASHELVRHRIGSYTQESTRYVSYDDNINIIIPTWTKTIEPGYYEKLNTDMITHMSHEEINWLQTMLQIENRYINSKLENDYRRGYLPINTKTEIIATYNVRQWRHVLKQRTTTHAHPQIRRVMKDVLKEFKGKMPILFEDLK